MSSSGASRISGSIIVVALLVAIAIGTFALAVAPARASGAAPVALPVGVSIHYTIPIGKGVDGGAYDTRNHDVYGSNQKSNNVTVVDSVTHSHSSIPVGKSPYSIVFDPNNGKLYVPNYNSSNVSIIYGGTNKVIANPSLGKGAHPVAVYVIPANGNVVVLNTSSYPSPSVAWIVNGSTNTVKKVGLGKGFQSMAVYDPNSKELYIPNQYADTLSAITTSGTVKTITLPREPNALFADPANHDLLVTLSPSSYRSPGSFVAINSADSIVKTVTVKAVSTIGSVFSAYDPYNHDVYFAAFNFSTNRSYAVIVAPNNSLAGTPALTKGVEAIVCFYDPANGDVFFDGAARDVVVVNQTSVVKTLNTTQPIILFTYDPVLKDMIGAGDTNLTTTSNLYIVTSANSVSSFKVGKDAIAFLYDPTDTYVYVANVGSDTVDLVG